ncbi:ABC transporter ATP-binding protein, partial [Chrysiogenes arsenatis]|uniref:ABC transporter ATP-binding protein n=1 Tax=Chrysiogenes arsenatis TaxID=309797 RepID=UPI0003F9ADD8
MQIELHDICVEYPLGGGKKTSALQKVSLHYQGNGNLGVIGESGSGKSTLARVIAGIEPKVHGTVVIDGVDRTHYSQAHWKEFRSKIQMVFQDPHTSLNPRMAIWESITEPLHVASSLRRTERIGVAGELLRLVGLREDDAYRYPHQFSGGQRQRITIARALSVKPQIIIADECTSSLDVSVQAQIMNLLSDITASTKTQFIFITHNLLLAEKFCAELVVLRHGKVIESGNCHTIFSSPASEYTRELIELAPRLRVT